MCLLSVYTLPFPPSELVADEERRPASEVKGVAMKEATADTVETEIAPRDGCSHSGERFWSCLDFEGRKGVIVIARFPIIMFRL